MVPSWDQRNAKLERMESFKLTPFVNNKDLASLTPQIKYPYEPSKLWKLNKFAMASNFIFILHFPAYYLMK
ncbi:MAG: hypothetical protein A2Y11_01250 [Planctomycetes bacterium GWC2_39_26]|nr:MAG: hypothetical protein A2Y11_01250 [Planctomycetes bacterium GWC2_39_26]